MRHARPSPTTPDDPLVRPRRRPWLVLLLILAVAPFSIDLFNLLRVNWDLYRGVQYPHAATPALDWLGVAMSELRHLAWSLVGRRLHDEPWRPLPTIVFAIGWAFAAGLLLRGSIRR
ncbi:MAG: hypothetical protein KatS3mg108_1962 [Isosphaeraceae bacterium]|jgi:hypothetical protein|nr:MAG: hypothetical protein KatS3mg108_1962 [Isosphaeraceae bacterium]